MLHIDIRSLTPGVHTERLSPSPEDVKLEADRFADISVDAHMDFDGKELLVHLDVSASATLECDRTLREFDHPVRGSFSVLYAPAEKIDENDDDREDMIALDPTADEIDITKFVRDTILLAIPQRKIAPGAEEEDIRTEYGEPGDDEVDPRWEALKKLKDD
ncbi:MAG: DUF177 domain-containing protein [Rhodothermales bacterium]|nr:DUF177 domain-containing protein [Rhodothermales bacterium]